jgi:hypothetical protein
MFGKDFLYCKFTVFDILLELYGCLLRQESGLSGYSAFGLVKYPAGRISGRNKTVPVSGASLQKMYRYVTDPRSQKPRGSGTLLASEVVLVLVAVASAPPILMGTLVDTPVEMYSTYTEDVAHLNPADYQYTASNFSTKFRASNRKR